MSKAISIELPDELYEQLQDSANKDQLSIEEAAIKSLAWFHGTSEQDIEFTLKTLDYYPDDRLWEIVRQEFGKFERLDELTALSKRQPLTDDQQTELEKLLNEQERLLLLRSKAMVVLKERGHEIQARLA